MRSRRRSLCETICTRIKGVALDYVFPVLKAAGFTYVLSETCMGLGARSYLNTSNTMNFLLSRENDQTSDAIVIPAITFGVISFVFSSLTRSRPTHALFYSEPAEEKRLADPYPVAISPVREVIGACVSYLAKGSCSITMTLTMGQTYASFATIYEKFLKTNPLVPDTHWLQIFFCLQGTLAAIYPYWGFNIKPAFANADDLGHFIARGALADINWEKAAYTLLLTSFNLVGSFYIGYFGLQNSMPRIVGIRNILTGPLLEDVSLVASTANVMTASVMMLRSVYNNLAGSIKVDLPVQYMPCIATLTCHKTANPWVLTKGVVYGLGFADIGVSGFFNSLTSTAKTLAQITRFQAQAPGVLVLGGVTGLGGVIMAGPFMIQGGFKRMFPKKTTLEAELNKPLLDNTYRIEINDMPIVTPPRRISTPIPIQSITTAPSKTKKTKKGLLSNQSFIVKASQSSQDLLEPPSILDISLSISI